jgi:hypothetical protein
VALLFYGTVADLCLYALDAYWGPGNVCPVFNEKEVAWCLVWTWPHWVCSCTAVLCMGVALVFAVCVKMVMNHQQCFGPH